MVENLKKLRFWILGESKQDPASVVAVTEHLSLPQLFFFLLVTGARSPFGFSRSQAHRASKGKLDNDKSHMIVLWYVP